MDPVNAIKHTAPQFVKNTFYHYLIGELSVRDEPVIFYPEYLKSKIDSIFSIAPKVEPYSDMTEHGFSDLINAKFTPTDASDILATTLVLNKYLLDREPTAYVNTLDNSHYKSSITAYENHADYIFREYLSNNDTSVINVEQKLPLEKFMGFKKYNYYSSMSSRAYRQQQIMTGDYKIGYDEFFASQVQEKREVPVEGKEDSPLYTKSSIRNSQPFTSECDFININRTAYFICLKSGSYDILKNYKIGQESIKLILELNKRLLKQSISDFGVEVGKSSIFLRNICKVI